MKDGILIERLSKSYDLRRSRGVAVRREIEERLRGGEGRVALERDFWALKDISLTVREGEILGVIGRNGAGKSTLLRVLALITEPTSGRLTLAGRPAALLETGAGFNGELNGRDNIRLSFAMFGQRATSELVDRAAAFAELGDFIDIPVKHYSSGMSLRLAFAVVAHLAAPVLLIDEVLAVSDLRFQEKCVAMLQRLAAAGASIVLVTHNLTLLPKICRRAVFLRAGQVAAQGEVSHVLDHYLGRPRSAAAVWTGPAAASAQAAVRIVEVRLTRGRSEPPEALLPTDSCRCSIRYDVVEPEVQGRLGLQIETDEGVIVAVSTDCDARGGFNRTRAVGVREAACELPIRILAPGNYHVSVFFSTAAGRQIDRVDRAVRFNVSRVGSLSLVDRRPGLVCPSFHWDSV